MFGGRSNKFSVNYIMCWFVGCRSVLIVLMPSLVFRYKSFGTRLRRLHLMNPAGWRPVCDQLRGFTVQTAVAHISHALPTWATVSLRGGGRVDGHLSPTGNVLDL